MDEMDIEHRLTEVEERGKANAHQIGELKKRQDNLDDLVSTVKVLANREEIVENDVKEIKENVKILTNKPGKMWDSMVEKIILTIAAAVIGFILARIGL